ncbi:MAG: hypothetical protein ACWGQW_01020, partial [bacterium]
GFGSWDGQTCAAWTSGHDGEVCGTDPKFLNRASNDFRLDTGSPAIGAGLTLGAPYNYGLSSASVQFPDPSLDTRSIPYDIGAYVAVTVDTTPPVISNPIPGTFPAGTTGGTVGVDTDETATCRYDLTPGTAYDNMVRVMQVAGNSHTALVGSTSYSDNFNRADENPLAEGWVQTASTGDPLRIVSQYVRGTANSIKNSSHYNSPTVSDMSSTMVVHNAQIGPAIRIQGAGLQLTGYWLYVNAYWTALSLVRFNGDDTFDGLVNISETVSPGDTVGISADGNSVVGYHNGSPVAGLSATDNTFVGGYAGIITWGKNYLGDNWSVAGLHPFSDGGYYHYYVRCSDTLGNKNTSDYDLLVSVESNVPSTIISPWPMRKIQ